MSSYATGSSPQVADHYTIAYEAAWIDLVQQRESRFGNTAIVKPAEGQATRFNQYGTRSFVAKTTRTPATPITASSLPVRWAYSAPFDDALVFDEWDEKFLGAVVLPTSASMQAQVYAWNRTKDQIFLNNILGFGYTSTAASGTSYTGGGVVPPIVGVSFDATNQVVSNTYVPYGGTPTTSGMTIAKIRKAKQIMDANEVPEEGRYLAISSKELNDLLGTTEITNNLYNDVRALVHGDVTQFLGFTVIRSELLPYYNASSETLASNYTDAGLQNILGITSPTNATVSFNNLTDISSTGIKSCVAWQRDMVAIVDGGKKAYMDVLPTQSHDLQIRASGVIGAARLQEKGVVAILSDQAA